ncbi:MAG: hypothetical protein J2P15_10770, partial [Micromonosporaceae bacterium]|nr:hypothetical protein [Micromonosporaceae bacterium]
TAAADAQFVSIFNSRPGMLPAAICRQSQAITNFGFAQLTGAPLGHTCGQIATDLRAFPTL